MGRATDLCTCEHDRQTYHAFGRCWASREGRACECPGFVPHPQPTTTELPAGQAGSQVRDGRKLSVGDQVHAHLLTLGTVRPAEKDGFYVITTETGEVWEVGIAFRRSSPKTVPVKPLQTTSPEGV